MRHEPLAILLLMVGLAAGCTDMVDVSEAGDTPRITSSACPPEWKTCYTTFLPAIAKQYPPSWPNSTSQKTSDRWLADNHANIQQMRPRGLALNFDNSRSMSDMVTKMQAIIAAMKEGSRYHGYADASARPFLSHQLAYTVDMRDNPPPAGWPVNNSTLYPREQPKQGYWGVDYEQFFNQQMADHYGIADPSNPAHKLTLCELSQRGLVHEVWVFADGTDLPGVNGAEVLGLMPPYDQQRQRIPGAPMNRCAGNGCFDEEDTIPASCNRTLRILFINSTRGAGCALESYSHAMESIFSNNLHPYLNDTFRRFAGSDLQTRYGTSFSSWYACEYNTECLRYPTSTSVNYNLDGFGPAPLSAQKIPTHPRRGAAIARR